MQRLTYFGGMALIFFCCLWRIVRRAQTSPLSTGCFPAPTITAISADTGRLQSFLAEFPKRFGPAAAMPFDAKPGVTMHMKNALSILLAVLVPAAAHADTLAVLNGVSVSYLSLRQNYSETYNGATLDGESGSIPGLGVTARATGRRGAYGQIGMRYFSGNDTYTGQLQNGTPAVGLTGNRILVLEARMGQVFPAARDLTVLPFTEFGFRTWRRDLGGQEPYTETYRNAWLGTGVSELYAPAWAGASRPLVVSASASASETFDASMATSGLSAYGTPDESFGLGHKFRYSLALAADYAMTRRLYLRFGVRYEQFGYGASAPVPIGGGYAMLEPNSTTRETTLHAGIVGSF